MDLDDMYEKNGIMQINLQGLNVVCKYYLHMFLRLKFHRRGST